MCKCTVKCFYFPDMSVQPGDWVYDEKDPNIKRRKTTQIFRCGYDNHIIDWTKECPKHGKNLYLENLKGNI